MVQSFVIIFCVLWIFSFLGFGSLLNCILNLKILKINENFSNNLKFLIYGFSGFIIVFCIGTLFNFFIPLGFVFSLIILISGIFLSIINFKLIFGCVKKDDIFILILLLIFCSIFSLMNNYNYDTGMYHVQTIKWIMQNKLVVGQANLENLFGYNSAWFTLQAVTIPWRFITKDPFYVLNSIILFFYGSAIFLTVKENLFKKLKLSSLFLILTFIPWFFCLVRFVSSPSTDIPNMYFSLFIVYLLIYQIENSPENYFYIFIAFVFSLFLLTVKMASALIVIWPFFLAWFYIFKDKKEHKATGEWFKNNQFFVLLCVIFSIIIIIPWLIRGFLLSGCFLFPSKFLYFKDVVWAIRERELDDVISSIYIFTRIGQNSVEMLKVPFAWIPGWFVRTVPHEIPLVITAIFACVLLVISIFKKNKIEKFSAFLFPFSLSSATFVFWFFSGPATKYGYGYMFSFFLLIIAFTLLKIFPSLKLFSEKTKHSPFILIIAVLMIFAGAVSASGKLNSIIEKIFISFLKRDFDAFYWFKMINAYSLAVFFTGAFILFQNYFLSKKFKNISIVFIFLAFVFSNQGIVLPEILNTKKLPDYKIEKHVTNDGLIVYQSNISGQSHDCPLPAVTYRFYPELKYRIDKNGQFEMFWFEKK